MVLFDATLVPFFCFSLPKGTGTRPLLIFFPFLTARFTSAAVFSPLWAAVFWRIPPCLFLGTSVNECLHPYLLFLVFFFWALSFFFVLFFLW